MPRAMNWRLSGDENFKTGVKKIEIHGKRRMRSSRIQEMTQIQLAASRKIQRTFFDLGRTIFYRS